MLKEADYTPESWKTVSEALAAAEKVVQDETATQEEADNAAKALNEAIKALQKKADKSALEAAIQEAKVLKEAD